MNANLSANLPWSLANPRWASTLNPVINSVSNLSNIPLLSGVQIDDISLIANIPKAVAHSLGFVPTGWFLVDSRSNGVVWRIAWTAQTITLEASANITISIWIY
jgi:hypothetical protein